MTNSEIASAYALGFLKRGFDVVLSLSMGIVAMPIVLIAALVVVATSSGPAIFSQDRVGRDRKVFRCYKLRTMVSGTASVPTHEASKSSITPLGRFLRATKIDELPQLWNVMRGEMSLVGPRPCLPTQHQLIEARARRGVFAIRPGITGHAQILGVDMSEPERLASLDADYLRTANLISDIDIAIRTVLPRRSR